ILYICISIFIILIAYMKRYGASSWWYEIWYWRRAVYFFLMLNIAVSGYVYSKGELLYTRDQMEMKIEEVRKHEEDKIELLRKKVMVDMGDQYETLIRYKKWNGFTYGTYTPGQSSRTITLTLEEP